MKIITSTTVRLGTGKDVKYLPPGEYDLDDKVAKGLLTKGHAKTLAVAAKETADTEKGPTVTKTGGEGGSK